jgi:hypothetical protein
MQIYADVTFTPVCGTWPVFPTAARAIQEIWLSSYPPWMMMLWEKLSMFNMHVILADQPKEFPREGNKFIMTVLINAGYANKALGQLNIVRVSLQLLFMLDILTASGNKISIEILSLCLLGEAWSNMRWPNKHPTDSNMQQWRNAMLLICPSPSSKSSIGQLIGRLHLPFIVSTLTAK